MENLELSSQIIENSIDVFRGGPAMIKEHQDRADKAMQIAKSILADWEAAYAEADPEKKKDLLANADARSNNFLSKCSSAKTEMADSRKAITQLMDTIKGLFTEAENKLDVKKPGPPAQIQTLRNTYAKWFQEEKARIEREAEAAAKKKEEAADLRANFNNQIAQGLIQVLAKRKQTVTDLFNAITFEEFEEKDTRVRAMNTEFPKDKLKIDFTIPVFRHHTTVEVEAIKDAVLSEYKFDNFYSEYKVEMEAMKRSLIDRLPSKLFELQEAIRLKKIEEENERKRQEEIERAKGEEKKRLEAEAEKKRIEAENERIARENERIAREDAEKERLRIEAEEKSRQASEAIEVEKAAEHANTLFEKVAKTAEVSNAPAAKKGFIIKVTHQAGWVELFTFWYQREGVKMSLAELEKKTFKQVKTYAEKSAKDGEMIESKFLKYEEEVKAINKKES